MTHVIVWMVTTLIQGLSVNNVMIPAANVSPHNAMSAQPTESTRILLPPMQPTVDVLLIQSISTRFLTGAPIVLLQF